jgi:hypothetical protein
MSRVAEMIIVLNHYEETLQPEADPPLDRIPCPARLLSHRRLLVYVPLCLTTSHSIQSLKPTSS